MVTVTNIKIHNSGDQKKVTATLTDITDGDTWEVPHIRDIEDMGWMPTSAAADQLKAVVSAGNTLTFTAVSSTTQDGQITVYGR